MTETEPQPGLIGPGALLKDRYRVERLLGRGGMASVWRARDEVLDRAVAVKLLSDTISSDPEFLARFRREARVAAGLWHPNLIGVYDYADGAERPYLVMEFVPGGDLASRIKHGAIDCERLARELLGAVAHIHAAGIVHRDIKPQNVLIAPNGSAKLIDFGIALPADATALTRTGHLLGTVRYLAPEVMNGGPASERSDLYSCGVLLRDCLGDGASASLSALVNRLADPDPRARPASAERALARLNAKPVLVEQPTERIPVPRPEPPPVEPGYRWPWGKAAVGAVALAALTAVFIGVFGGSGGGGGAGDGRPGQIRQAGKAQKTANSGGKAAEPADSAESEPSSEEATEERTEEPASPPAAEAASETGNSLNQEGFEMIQAGRYEEAVPVLEEAVGYYPSGGEDLGYAYALFNLGNALRLSGRPEEAIPVLEERLQIPNQTDVVREELAAAESEAGE
jgi:eukaryotic-like serine/threonine-protein kinase